MPEQQDNQLGQAGMPAYFSGDTKAEQPLTFGEKLVGKTFNPSGDDKVAKAKQLCAELAELINISSVPDGVDEYLFRLVRDNAMNDILTAQMKVVKLLTLK